MFSSLPSMYSIHAADAAAVLALCPFARSLQMAYCAAIGGSLSSQSSPLSSAWRQAGANREPDGGRRRRRRRLQAVASPSGSTQSIRWLRASLRASRQAGRGSLGGWRAWPTPPPSPRLWRRRCRRWRSGPNRSAARQGREREILLTFHFPSIAASRICICSRLDGN